jgi:uncharacterized OB-fold protein
MWIAIVIISLVIIGVTAFAVLTTGRTRKKWIRDVLRDEGRKAGKCSNCGALLSVSDVFCSKCGRKVMGR